MTTSDKIKKEVQLLAPSAKIELYELDLTAFGDTVYRFHDGKNEVTGNIVWQGNTYNAWPAKASGFDFTSDGKMPRPRLVLGNVTGTITAFILAYQDLCGAIVRRKRTRAKYLDAINFTGGVNADADPTAAYEDDVYQIERKVAEAEEFAEFELAASVDVAGVGLPRRYIIQNVCPWRYRGGECGYTGTDYFDVNDNPVASAELDICGKRLGSCGIRFGSSAQLPFGGFPGAGLVR